MALAGSEAAYTAIVNRYQRMVYSLANDITTNPEDAEEAVQDAFIKAFRYLGNWRGECRFSTWLYHVARTTAIDRRNRRRLNTVSLDDDSNDYGTRLKRIADTTPGADEGLLNGERRTQIHEALALLMPPDRNVLILYYLKDQSLEEICQIMGWTMSNAKSRLSRARQRLRLLMDNSKEQFSLN
jgi:RNA polymerase sigma-70 factor (ECF subfamily)